MEAPLLQILHNSHTEQTPVTLITIAGNIQGIVSTVHEQAVELRDTDGKRCWVLYDKIVAIRYK